MDKKQYLYQRNKYKPDFIKAILILESPPVSGNYFYNEAGSIKTSLFSSMMELIGLSPSGRHEGLKYFANAGFMIVDAVYTPVNHLSSKERDRTVLDNFNNLVADLRSLGDPARLKIILVKANICRILEDRLVNAGFNVLNRGRIIPFPSHWHKKNFLKEIRGIFLSSGISIIK